MKTSSVANSKNKQREDGTSSKKCDAISHEEKSSEQEIEEDKSSLEAKRQMALSMWPNQSMPKALHVVHNSTGRSLDVDIFIGTQSLLAMTCQSD